ncbi:MAG: glycosyltransferase family 2 protein [Acidobacteriota bacterium]
MKELEKHYLPAGPAGDAAGVDESAAVQTTVAAVIVLYRPDPAVFARLIASIASQVQKIFVVDNTPGAQAPPAGLEDCACPLAYHANGKNKGLAAAQNLGLEQAICHGFTHVLLLDQDSTLPPGAVDGLLAAEQALLRQGRPVAAVGPLYIDEKTGERSRGVRHSWIHIRWDPIPLDKTEPVLTDYVIASGSLIRTSVLLHVGLMRDELFIDWVDTEWSYRANSYGYEAYIVPTVSMRHNVGDATGHFLGRRFNLHNPIRNYYIVRNAVYLLKDSRMSPRWRFTMLIYVPKYILVHAWLSRDRWSSFKQMLRGAFEGLTGRMRQLSAS